jgi:rhamnosyltransferase
VFAHFDPDSIVDPHVQFLLLQLNTVSDELVFVSTSGATLAYLNALNLPVSRIITRENTGFDFYSWKMGLATVSLAEFDELILCNDSVYGPLVPLADVFNEMAERPCAFWGITDNKQLNFHLQSYFLVFRSSVTHSSTFEKFWKQVQPLKNKQDVIVNYEIRLTPWLMAEGFEPQAYFRPTFWDGIKTYRIALGRASAALCAARGNVKAFAQTYRTCRTLNKTHYFWKEMIRRNAPFVKIELLKTNPERRRIAGVLSEIQRSSDYPVRLIRDHQRRINRTSLGSEIF